MDYGILSVAPPLLTIVLAIISKDVMLALLLGILSGFLILQAGHPLTAAISFLDHLVLLFAEAWVVKTLIFSLLVGSVMRLLGDSGGVGGLVHFLTQRTTVITSSRSAQMLAFIIGLVIFIESSITSLVAGTVARPLFDQYGVSRQKLAYICDATSAPVCSLLPLNGWGGLLIGLLSAQIANGSLAGNAVDILLHALLYNFYAWFSLVLVFIAIWYDWNIGSMAHYEAKTTAIDVPIPRDGGHMANILVPLAVLIGMIPVALLYTGSLNLKGATFSVSWVDLLFAGSGSSAVFYAVFTTLLVAFIQYVLFGAMSRKAYFGSLFSGAAELLPIVVILIFAFMIGNITQELHTGRYLALLASGWLSPGLIPLLVFLLAATIAFATGTSWGTFSIMLPIGVTLAGASGADAILVVGAVISGGVFGDHASPISDTTIIASLAAGCDVMEHTHSQLPYALLAGGAAALLFMVFGLINA